MNYEYHAEVWTNRSYRNSCSNRCNIIVTHAQTLGESVEALEKAKICDKMNENRSSD